MTINIVRGLVDSLQSRQQNNLKTENANNSSNQTKQSSGQAQATQSNLLARNVAVSEAVVSNFKSNRAVNSDSERVKDSKSAKELAKGISDKVRGDSQSAANAHQLSSESGQALLV